MTSPSSHPKSGIRHRFSGALYTSDGPNRVKVSTPEGTFGIFDGIGRWIEGELFEADPEMCIWMSINRIEASHRQSPQESNPNSTE
jgi:hypothetical protein